MEPECVLEVCRAPAEDGLRECRLHVLSDSDDIRVYPGQSLCIYGEAPDPKSGEHRESMFNIGDVGEVLDSITYPEPDARPCD
jgi:hypothetical protein